jgi:malonate-semialdehyde dehydrogenase (acetylating) / methylmalonate-semialdehyde dehydrogenase
MSAQVVEAATGIGNQLLGSSMRNVASSIDCYSHKQPLGVVVRQSYWTFLVWRSLAHIRARTCMRGTRTHGRVQAGICPFNFPAMCPLWMFPLAIGAGNTFILVRDRADPILLALGWQCW